MLTLIRFASILNNEVPMSATVDFYLFRAEIENIEPAAWREFYMPTIASFRDLHEVLQIMFGWRRASRYEFACGMRIGNAYSDDIPAPLNDRLVVLDQMAALEIDYTCTVGTKEWRARITRTDDSVYEGETTTGPPEVTSGSGFPDRPPSPLAADVLRGSDIDAMNAALSQYSSDTPATWVSSHTLRADIDSVAMHQFEVRKSVDLSRDRFFISSHPYTREDFIQHADTRPRIYREVVSRKNGSSIAISRGLEPVIFLLDICNDVPSFRSFPSYFKWQQGDDIETTFSDIQVRGKNRSNTDLFIATDDTEEDLGRWLKSEGASFSMLTQGFLSDHVIESCRAIMACVNEDVWRVPHTMSETRLNGFGYSFSTAISTLGGENKVLGAIAQGKLGIDFREPHRRAMVGHPSITEKTCSFWNVAQKYLIP
jgi:hypothetical protein